MLAGVPMTPPAHEGNTKIPPIDREKLSDWSGILVDPGGWRGLFATVRRQAGYPDALQTAEQGAATAIRFLRRKLEAGDFDSLDPIPIVVEESGFFLAGAWITKTITHGGPEGSKVEYGRIPEPVKAALLREAGADHAPLDDREPHSELHDR
jgi:hypothetical protein